MLCQYLTGAEDSKKLCVLPYLTRAEDSKKLCVVSVSNRS